MSKVISIDLEMNMPSQKIIQLGYVIGDPITGRVFVSRSLTINPNENLNPEITALTGISQADVDGGMSLETAYRVMKEDVEKHNCSTTPVQWGEGDSRHLRQELGLSPEEYVFRNRTFDVKTVYQTKQLFNRNKVAAGLAKAMEHEGYEFVGTPHRALDDAYNTFIMFRHLGNRFRLADKMEKVFNDNT
jgi:inhibitor of KinA sporulation pathway (predicted exonuclease)